MFILWARGPGPCVGVTDRTITRQLQVDPRWGKFNLPNPGSFGDDCNWPELFGCWRYTSPSSSES